MGAGIGLVVYAAVMVIAGIVGVVATTRSANRRLDEIVAALEAHGARVLSRDKTHGLVGQPQCRFELGAHKGRVSLRWWGRSTWRVRFELDGASRPGMWVRLPAGFDGPARMLGLRRNIVLGSSEVAVATRASARAVEAMLAPEEVRRLIGDLVATSGIFALVGAGNEVFIGPSGVGAVAYTGLAWRFQAERTASILDHLNALDAALPKLEASEATPLGDSRSIMGSLASAAAPAIAVMILMSNWHRFPREQSAVNELLAVGALAFVIAVGLLTRGLRGRPNALRELIFGGMGLAVAVPFFVVWLLAVANVTFDDSPVVAHRSRVVDFYRRNTHTVYVEPWTAGGPREKIVVQPSEVRTIAVGDTLLVQTRAGALGLSWVSGVSKE